MCGLGRRSRRVPHIRCPDAFCDGANLHHVHCSHCAVTTRGPQGIDTQASPSERSEDTIIGLSPFCHTAAASRSASALLTRLPSTGPDPTSGGSKHEDCDGSSDACSILRCTLKLDPRPTTSAHQLLPGCHRDDRVKCSFDGSQQNHFDGSRTRLRTSLGGYDQEEAKSHADSSTLGYTCDTRA